MSDNLNLRVQNHQREWILMHQRIDAFTDDDLKRIWEALRGYDPADNYAPGITMDDWAQAIYNEMQRRSIPTV